MYSKRRSTVRPKVLFQGKRPNQLANSRIRKIEATTGKKRRPLVSPATSLTMPKKASSRASMTFWKPLGTIAFSMLRSLVK